MASKLYITEYEDPHSSASFPMQVGMEDGNSTDQVVDYSGGAAASAAFGARTRFIRLHTDSICSIKFGTAPTAATTNRRLAANQTEYYGVRPGDKVSGIINT